MTLVHHYVKSKQAAHMEELIASCDGENIVLQVDFSENATIKMQSEIQSAHWNHSEVTLFTAHEPEINLSKSLHSPNYHYRNLF